ncbi:Cation-independent mannose-6-phosphate receptor CI-MPR [Massospora cicadina]|nr:Cation-independent mannose-6-phosphate receptor CI-MPR [Massospora cicadina]
MKVVGDFLPFWCLTFTLLAFVSSDTPIQVPYCGAHNVTSHDLYDLSSLIKTTGDNYKIEIPAEPSRNEKKRTFEFNVCNPLPTTPAGITAGSNVASYLKEEGSAAGISLGKNSSRPILRDGSLYLLYKDGANCTANNVTRARSTMILFTCIDPLIVRPPTFVGDFDGCEYVFEWKTSAACPTSDTSPSAGTIIFRLSCMGVFFYLLVGIIYNRFVKNAQGLEQIPNFNFWFGIYDFIKDMVLIIAVKACDAVISFRNKPSQYQSVPPSDINSLAIDDEDDEL